METVHAHFDPKLNREYGGSLFLIVADLHPDAKKTFTCPYDNEVHTGQGIVIPLAAIADRQRREGLPVCDDLACFSCDKCLAGLDILLDEHFVFHNADEPERLASNKSIERLAKIGAVPSKVWCEDCKAAEAPDTHAKAQAVVDVLAQLSPKLSDRV